MPVDCVDPLMSLIKKRKSQAVMYCLENLTVFKTLFMPLFVLTLWQLVWFSGSPLLQDSFGAALKLSKRISDFSGLELMFIVCS